MANYNKYINSTSTHYLSNSGGDERGKLNSGQAGDQTGKEWQLRAWYNRPWTHVFRYEKDPRVGETLCNLGCAAALNDNIGYDQYQRTTYWTQLQKVGYDPAKITTKCEEDCSAGVAANVKAAGYILGIKALQDVSSSMTSRNTVSNLTKAGFTVLTDRKYLINGDYLQPGDILLYVNHHVSMNITKGKKAEATIESKPVEDLAVIGTAIAKGNMRVRQSPNTSAYAYGTINVNNKVEVVEITSDNWYKIKYKGSPTGYAYTSNRNNLYYKYSDLKKEDTTRYITTGSVNLRKDAGTDKKILVALSKGTEVEVLSNSKTIKNVIWHEAQVTYKKINYRGYISSRYLKRV